MVEEEEEEEDEEEEEERLVRDDEPSRTWRQSAKAAPECEGSSLKAVDEEEEPEERDRGPKLSTR